MGEFVPNYSAQPMTHEDLYARFEEYGATKVYDGKGIVWEFQDKYEVAEAVLGFEGRVVCHQGRVYVPSDGDDEAICYEWVLGRL